MTDMEKEAKELLDKAKAERAKMSQKAEPKGAAPASPAEIKKTEGKTEEEKLKEAEVAKKAALDKDKEDEVILSKKDEELDDKQKARKSELLKIKKDVEEKDKKDNVQKRIDELSGKVKALENDNASTKADRDAARKELDDLKKQLRQTPDDKIKEKVKKELSTRVTKYIEEDKDLPREERREMTKEELDEWLTEDLASAQDWIAGRRIRRYREEETLKHDERLNVKASEVMDRFNKGYEIQISKHPELDISKRKAELEKEGKSKKEIRKILGEENPKWGAFMEIFESDMNKYLEDEDGPARIADAMEKKLKPKEEKKDTEVEELKKKVADLEAENQRLSGLDVEISSTRQVEPKTPEPEIIEKTKKLGLDLGLSKDQVERAVERRKGARK